jgi:hypothetical protein
MGVDYRISEGGKVDEGIATKEDEVLLASELQKMNILASDVLP